MGSGVDHEGVVTLTQQLVRVPSVNRPDEGLSEAPAAALVAERMRELGWEPLVEEAAPGRPNVIATVEGGLPGPTLLFEGHTDVVSEGDPESWAHPPFSGEIVDGRLLGRGAADMKGGVAAMIHAVAALQARGPFPGRVRVAALADEEGLMLGVKDFVARGHADDVDAAIVCEPEAGEVCTTSKGSVRVRVDARGVMAHGAMPDHGCNPVPALARYAMAMVDLEEELQDEVGRHPTLGWPFVTPTVALAGDLDQINVICAHAQLAVDIRITPTVDTERLLARMREHAEAIGKECEVALELSVVDDRPSTETPESAPITRAMVEAHEAVTGERAVIGGVPGATDGTILWRDANLPVVVYGPGGKWIAHQVDEYVDVEELCRAADVYVEAAHRFLHG